MPIDRDRLLNWKFEDVEHNYTCRDTMLYALSLGVGSDPVDEDQLRFVFEKDLATLPSMAVVLAYPGLWLQDSRTGANWQQLLHGEQGIQLERPLPAEATVVGCTKVLDVLDKGERKGAHVLTERVLYDKASGERLARLTSTAILRADGGFGGPSSGPLSKLRPPPDRKPDVTSDMPVLPQAALLYRLLGDYNPLHADPELARNAGFQRPILHGLCTFGIAGYALVKTVCNSRPERMAGMSVRFSAPAYPGETIRTEIWIEPEMVCFRARAVERDVVVLTNGVAQIAENVHAVTPQRLVNAERLL